MASFAGWAVSEAVSEEDTDHKYHKGVSEKYQRVVHWDLTGAELAERTTPKRKRMRTATRPNTTLPRSGLCYCTRLLLLFCSWELFCEYSGPVLSLSLYLYGTLVWNEKGETETEHSGVCCTSQALAPKRGQRKPLDQGTTSSAS